MDTVNILEYIYLIWAITDKINLLIQVALEAKINTYIAFYHSRLNFTCYCFTACKSHTSFNRCFFLPDV